VAIRPKYCGFKFNRFCYYQLL